VSTEPYFVLNRNQGVDTIHHNPREECNVDDAEGRETIDGTTVEALLDRGDAVRCQHCYAEEQA
jgi:hypothetical protein